MHRKEAFPFLSKVHLILNIIWNYASLIINKCFAYVPFQELSDVFKHSSGLK